VNVGPSGQKPSGEVASIGSRAWPALSLSFLMRRNSPPSRRIDSGENLLKSSHARRRPQLADIVDKVGDCVDLRDVDERMLQSWRCFCRAQRRLCGFGHATAGIADLSLAIFRKF
jgi:hypothetical protein